MPLGGARVSKRVMATDEQGQAARVTRQRTRNQSSTDDVTAQGGSTEDALAAVSSPTPAQPDEQILMSTDGKCYSSFLKAVYGLHICTKTFTISNNCEC